MTPGTSSSGAPDSRLLALRGAITLDADTKDEVSEKTQRLVKEMLARNDVNHDDLVSIIFTATDDVTSEFPAAAARALGLGDVPLLCARELGIAHGMPLCVRVLMHLYSERRRGRAAPRLPRGRPQPAGRPPRVMGTVAVVGTGLIGGSLGLALRRAGLRVQGYDADADRLARAVARGAVDVAAESLLDAYAGADVAFVAVTVSGVADAVAAALDAGVGAVSDVGSVKAPVVRAVEARARRAAARFVGGHPMAGSAGEEGIEGADADLFAGRRLGPHPDRHHRPRRLHRGAGPGGPHRRRGHGRRPASCTTSWWPPSATCPTWRPAPSCTWRPTRSPTTRPCSAWPPAVSGP